MLPSMSNLRSIQWATRFPLQSTRLHLRLFSLVYLSRPLCAAGFGRQGWQIQWSCLSWMQYHCAPTSGDLVLKAKSALNDEKVNLSRRLRYCRVARKMSRCHVECHLMSSCLFNIRTVTLEGNPLPEQSYHLLLSEDSMWVTNKLNIWIYIQKRAVRNTSLNSHTSSDDWKYLIEWLMYMRISVFSFFRLQPHYSWRQIFVLLNYTYFTSLFT